MMVKDLIESREAINPLYLKKNVKYFNNGSKYYG